MGRSKREDDRLLGSFGNAARFLTAFGMTTFLFGIAVASRLLCRRPARGVLLRGGDGREVAAGEQIAEERDELVVDEAV